MKVLWKMETGATRFLRLCLSFWRHIRSPYSITSHPVYHNRWHLSGQPSWMTSYEVTFDECDIRYSLFFCSRVLYLSREDIWAPNCKRKYITRVTSQTSFYQWLTTSILSRFKDLPHFLENMAGKSRITFSGSFGKNLCRLPLRKRWGVSEESIRGTKKSSRSRWGSTRSQWGGDEEIMKTSFHV